jgi:hypothetical protein
MLGCGKHQLSQALLPIQSVGRHSGNSSEVSSPVLPNRRQKPFPCNKFGRAPSNSNQYAHRSDPELSDPIHLFYEM